METLNNLANDLSKQLQETKSQIGNATTRLDTQSAQQRIRENFARYDIARHPSCKALRDRVAKWAYDVYQDSWTRKNRLGLVLWAADRYDIPDPDKDNGSKTVAGSAYGNGKTMLAKMAYNSLGDILTTKDWPHLADKSGIYIEAEKWAQGISDAMDHKELGKYMLMFHRAAFVIYDDMGSEGTRDDSLQFWQARWRDMLTYAFDGYQPFLVTTNLNLTQLQARLGGKNWDRLDGICGGPANFLNFSAIPSQRKVAKP